MNEITDKLAGILLKKNSLQECSQEELEILADKYPYFGAAQLLVSGKLKEENTAAYETQVQKTSLYFFNPLWLDYILNKENGVIQYDSGRSQRPDSESSAIKTEEATFTESPVIEQEETSSSSVEEATEPELIQNESGRFQRPDSPGNFEQINEPAGEIIKETPVEKNSAEEINISPLRTEPFDENALLPIEPYHTVDYFASQGIKLSPEEKPKDKFGQQLKSFTQWLKTLKSTPPSEIAKEQGQVPEQKVIALAEHSLENKDIVTETMAEVWAKQGKTEKAIEVYRKLSLQNPSKSSYFAGLIEQLKQH